MALGEPRLNFLAISPPGREERLATCYADHSPIAENGNGAKKKWEEGKMASRFRFHRPHVGWPHVDRRHVDWLADLALVGALAVLVLATAVLCSFVPWS